MVEGVIPELEFAVRRRHLGLDRVQFVGLPIGVGDEFPVVIAVAGFRQGIPEEAVRDFAEGPSHRAEVAGNRDAEAIPLRLGDQREHELGEISGLGEHRLEAGHSRGSVCLGVQDDGCGVLSQFKSDLIALLAGIARVGAFGT